MDGDLGGLGKDAAEELFRVVDRVKNVDAGLEDTLMVKVNKKR